ncbi:hypothetical protein L1887_02924 [Cichorium endivia]|nr:hypothetical protein L1887_02924 [Cichorium endivia]
MVFLSVWMMLIMQQWISMSFNLFFKVDHFNEKLDDWIDEERAQKVHDVDVHAIMMVFQMICLKMRNYLGEHMYDFLNNKSPTTMQPQVEEEESKSEDNKVSLNEEREGLEDSTSKKYEEDDVDSKCFLIEDIDLEGFLLDEIEEGPLKPSLLSLSLSLSLMCLRLPSALSVDSMSHTSTIGSSDNPTGGEKSKQRKTPTASILLG